MPALKWTDEDGDTAVLTDYAETNGGDEGEQALLSIRGADDTEEHPVLIEKGTAESVVRWLTDFYDLEPLEPA